MKDILRGALIVLAIIIIVAAVNNFVHIDYVGVFKTYGLAGVFLISLISATIFFTFPGEFALLLAITLMPKEGVLIAGTFGALIGSCINYFIGRKGIRAIHKVEVKREKKEEAKANVWFAKYGQIMIFFAPFVPFLGDAITVVAGALKMPFERFFILNLVGRIVKNAILLYALAGIIGF